MSSATARAPRVSNAFWSILAKPARPIPCRSGTAAPITPLRRITGTTGVSLRHLAGTSGPKASSTGLRILGIGFEAGMARR
jgi:hypothetical protein